MVILHLLSAHIENISNMLHLSDVKYSQVTAETEHRLKLLINLMFYALSSEILLLVHF